MPIEDKVAQLIQVDIASIKPEDIADIRIGSILNGGNSSPNNDERAPPAEWLKLADRFWRASMAPRPGRPTIPIMWGTDAVHADNNIVGATLFPHNIGLGAARDPNLIERIGRATAEETAATGIDWSFAPTLAVVQDARWGRSYESYSEEPSVVASYAGRMVAGVQGPIPGVAPLASGHVIATAKHFVGEGGTGGRDQGDTVVPEGDLIGIHAAGYGPALHAGALTMMVSFSSWNGAKMHGNRSLLTDVLKTRMAFDGLLVGDWNAHAQVPGCSVTHCAAAITGARFTPIRWPMRKAGRFQRRGSTTRCAAFCASRYSPGCSTRGPPRPGHWPGDSRRSAARRTAPWPARRFGSRWSC